MEKLKPSVIFIDLDGTTYDIHKKGKLDVSDENKKTIKELNKKVPVIISTGRSKEYAYKIQKELGLKYSVIQNGALILNEKGEIVYKDSINKKEAEEILRFAKEYNAGTKVNDEKKFYGIPRIIRGIIKTWGFESTHKHYKTKSDTEYIKLIIIGKTRLKNNRLIKKLRKKYLHLNIVTSAKGLSIEITGQSSSKGFGNKWVSDAMNLDVNKGVHFGDSMNDSTAADFMRLIAMKNSARKLKKCATIISKFKYKNAGLKKSMYKYLEI